MQRPTISHNRTGRITLEYWQRNANEPTTFCQRPDGRTTLESPTVLAGWTEQHDVRLRGYIYPPQSGAYVFTSSGNVELVLGEGNSQSSSRHVLAADSTCSEAISLIAGNTYYIEVRCTARDHQGEVYIGWQLPDGAQTEKIDGAYCSPYNSLQKIPAAHDILSTLSRQHPRLLASAYDFAVQRACIRRGDEQATRYAAIKEQGLALLQKPAPQYTYTDPYAANFEGRGNELIEMMETLGFIYHIEIEGGDQDLAQRCLERAWSELEAASHFEHWDTEHFAGTARTAHAYGMGYDWFYNAFTPAQRAVVRRAIVELGLKKYADELNTGPFGWHQWTIMKGNWNCTINGDTGVAILAVAGEDDYLAADILHKLMVNVQNFSMMTYYPDGGTRESPSYWAYKDRYFMPFLPALETALGSDFGIGATEGFAQTGLYPIHSMGPAGQFFNYSDGNPHWGATASLFYLAKAFNTPLYAWVYRDRFPDTVSVRSALWHDERGSEQDLLDLPLDHYFSDAEVVYMRGAWRDDSAAWVGFAATDNWDFIHGQLDQGTFVFDALGQRWATDFGADNYGLPGFWDKDMGGVRWKIYRNRAEGHNTLVINPGSTHEDQHPMAKGKIVDFAADAQSPFAIADLSDAYKQNGALKVRRGVKLLDRKVLLIRDELTLANPAEVWWFMHTQAEIAVAADGRSATLSQGGKEVEAILLAAPQEAKFAASDAERLATSPGPTAGEIGAQGYRKLAIQIEGATQLELAVALVPKGSSVDRDTAALAAWKL